MAYIHKSFTVEQALTFVVRSGIAVGILNDHVVWVGVLLVHHHELAPILHWQGQQTLHNLEEQG